jgi:hypothetical protein
MHHRFRCGLKSPVSQSEKQHDHNPECPSCAAFRRAKDGELFDPLPELHSPLTPGVQLVNLSYSEELHSLRVNLSVDWARMFGQLPLAGRGLVMSRNATAILGRRMEYPTLRVTSGGGKGASGAGGLWLNFRHFDRARAVHRRSETGHVFGIEFGDGNGHLVHRFILLPEGNLDEFLAWVRLHQACAAHSSAAWPAEEAARPELVQPLRNCDSDALVALVAACVERAVPLRITVCGVAVTQRIVFTPHTLRPSEDWWSASNDDASLHFNPDLFGHITLEEHAGERSAKHIALRATTEDGANALVLEVGSLAALDLWQELLDAMT